MLRVDRCFRVESHFQYSPLSGPLFCPGAMALLDLYSILGLRTLMLFFTLLSKPFQVYPRFSVVRSDAKALISDSLG